MLNRTEPLVGLTPTVIIFDFRTRASEIMYTEDVVINDVNYNVHVKLRSSNVIRSQNRMLTVKTK